MLRIPSSPYPKYKGSKCLMNVGTRGPEDRMKFVKESGFDYSREDIKQVKSELSEDELGDVAAGFGDVCGSYEMG